MSNKKKYIDYYELYGSLGCYHRPSLTPDQQKMYDWIMGEIDNAEAADVVEVKHGRWIVENEESIRCSECCFNRASIKIPMDYCLSCGARMDLKGE